MASDAFFLHFRSSYHVLIPRLVFLNDFEQVKSIASHLKQDWRQLVANCFPKIMVNILPHFAVPGHDAEAARQRENAHQVYELLKDDQCLGKQVPVKVTTFLWWKGISMKTSLSTHRDFIRIVLK